MFVGGCRKSKKQRENKSQKAHTAKGGKDGIEPPTQGFQASALPTELLGRQTRLYRHSAFAMIRQSCDTYGRSDLINFSQGRGKKYRF